MGESTEGRRNGTQLTLWKRLDSLDFAYDIALLAHYYNQMQDKSTQLEELTRELSFSVSKVKTKNEHHGQY